MTSRAGEHVPGAKPPRVSALRLVGPAAEHAAGRIAAPLGATFTADAPDYALVLGAADAASASTVARALLDPDELPAGTLLVVLPRVMDPPSLASRLLAALGRGKTVPRALRSTALVARGYVRVEAGIDRKTQSDLVWGYAPAKRAQD
jgi:hypothetical protein